MLECVQIPSKSVKMNTTNITNYKPKDFAELLAYLLRYYNVEIEKKL